MVKRASNDGIKLIMRSESLQLNAYKCPADVWTIGFGRTKGVKAGDVIDNETAVRYLIEDVGEFENVVNELVKVPLTQSQFDALVSFTFNVGRGAFLRSSLRRLLNKGQYHAAAAEFRRWVYAKGIVMPGLVERRRAEEELFRKDM